MYPHTYIYAYIYLYTSIYTTILENIVHMCTYNTCIHSTSTYTQTNRCMLYALCRMALLLQAALYTISCTYLV